MNLLPPTAGGSSYQLPSTSATLTGLRRAALITLLVAGFLHPTLPPTPALAASQTALNLQRMLEYNNAERSARGVRSLSRDSRLDAQAQRWAEKLAAEGKMYHSPSTYALNVGFRSGAENLAYHDFSLSASQAHNMWMDSSTHRRNMLDPAFYAAGFGIACSTKSGRAYAIAVVEFGGDSPPANSTPSANPHVAGGQSMTGVGCSGSERGETQPPLGSAKSPAAAPVASAPAPSKTTPAGKPQDKQGNSPSVTGAKAKPSTSPTAASGTKPPDLTTKEGLRESTENQIGIAGTSPPGQTPEVDEDAAGAPSKTDTAELASARAASAETDSGRLLLTGLAALAAYLFLIRVFGVKRPQRRSYSARHSQR